MSSLVKEFYYILIIDTEKPPLVLTRYQNPRNIFREVTSPGLFKPTRDIGKVLSRGIGWLLWGQLKGILEITRGEFQSQVEKRFVDNLIVYLEYKIREGERIKNERKQLSFR